MKYDGIAVAKTYKQKIKLLTYLQKQYEESVKWNKKREAKQYLAFMLELNQIIKLAETVNVYNCERKRLEAKRYVNG